jgi:hypothetical protein
MPSRAGPGGLPPVEDDILGVAGGGLRPAVYPVLLPVVRRQLPASGQENAWAPRYRTARVSLDGIGIIRFFQQEWLLNGFLLLNAVLGLLLFDKLVLKPFFEKKRQALVG